VPNSHGPGCEFCIMHPPCHLAYTTR
jgi:hypothetical protein